MCLTLIITLTIRKDATLTESKNMVWQYTTVDGEVRYLLAPNLELAAWRAAELSGGSENLKDVVLHYDS